jgi:hypothetical protein
LALSRHGKNILETKCVEVFHITWCEFQTQCLTIQSISKVWCIVHVYKFTKNGTLIFAYKGQNKAPRFDFAQSSWIGPMLNLCRW